CLQSKIQNSHSSLISRLSADDLHDEPRAEQVQIKRLLIDGVSRFDPAGDVLHRERAELLRVERPANVHPPIEIQFVVVRLVLVGAPAATRRLPSDPAWASKSQTSHNA